jgi:hypothetical protein
MEDVCALSLTTPIADTLDASHLTAGPTAGIGTSIGLPCRPAGQKSKRQAGASC